MDLRISETDILSHFSFILSFDFYSVYVPVFINFFDLLSQFCCYVCVRLGSALGSRDSDRGFDARLDDKFLFFYL